MIEKVIVFVEEPSAEAALENLLPNLLEQVDFEIRVFQCKDELLKRLPERLAGYCAWIPENWIIVVLVDKDDDDCHTLKRRLESIAESAGLVTKTVAAGNRFHVVNRILIEELEAWFFGDWPAVEAAYPRVPATIPQKSSFRDPDEIVGGTWEALERVLQRAGYFRSGLRKIECARAVTRHMVPLRNRSRSFHKFREAIATTVVEDAS